MQRVFNIIGVGTIDTIVLTPHFVHCTVLNRERISTTTFPNSHLLDWFHPLDFLYFFFFLRISAFFLHIKCPVVTTRALRHPTDPVPPDMEYR